MYLTVTRSPQLIPLIKHSSAIISFKSWATISAGKIGPSCPVIVLILPSHSVSNPDQESERRLLSQLAPELDEHVIRRLVAAFQDLRRGYDSGVLTYPYSLRGTLSNLSSNFDTDMSFM
jgi:hypothetical protein